MKSTEAYFYREVLVDYLPCRFGIVERVMGLAETLDLCRL
jgi:hypothetical protein